MATQPVFQVETTEDIPIFNGSVVGLVPPTNGAAPGSFLCASGFWQVPGQNGASGMTNPMTTLGDIIYEDATPQPTRLPGNTGTRRQWLGQRGTGGLSGVPFWGNFPEYILSDFSSLSVADAACAAAGGVLALSPGTFTIAASISIASPVRFMGAVFSINTGQVMTFAGGIVSAPMSQIFSGAGTVQLSATTPVAYPEWWGATHGSSGDDSVAINAAILACNNASGPATFSFANFSYYLKNPITVTKVVPIRSSTGGSINPSGSSPSTNCIIFGGTGLGSNFNYAVNAVLPNIGAFSGTGIGLYDTCLAHIVCNNNAAAVPVEFLADGGVGGTQCLDNTVIAQALGGQGASSPAAIKVTSNGSSGSTLQGNRVEANFIINTSRWVYFAGTSANPNNNVNYFQADAVDLDNVPGAIAIDNATTYGNAQNQFICTGFFGGLLSAVPWVAATPYTVSTQVTDPSNNIVYNCTHAISTWTTSTVYTVGQYVYDPGHSNDIYVCTVGLTSTTQPHLDASHWSLSTTNANSAPNLNIINWGTVGTAAKIGNGSFGQCCFDFGAGGGEIQTYAQFGLTEGGTAGFGNEYRAGFGIPGFGHSVGVASPIPATTSANTRSTFNGGFPIVNNRLPISCTLTGNVTTGGLATFWAYSPFVLGNARIGFASWGTNNQGGYFIEDASGNVLLPTQIFDHTAVNPNEIKIQLRNISPNTILSGTVVALTLVVGV